MAKLNKINLNGVSYDIEDANAQSQLGTLTGDLSQEVSNRQSAVQGVQDNLDNEVKRAKAAEKKNADAIAGLKTQVDGLDLTLYVIVDSLPTSDIKTNKIYLVRNSSGAGNNIYTEYAYINSAWEKIGEYKADVDLSNYYNKSQVNNLLSGKADASNVYTKSQVDSMVGNKVTAEVSNNTLNLTIR